MEVQLGQYPGFTHKIKKHWDWEKGILILHHRIVKRTIVDTMLLSFIILFRKQNQCCHQHWWPLKKPVGLRCLNVSLKCRQNELRLVVNPPIWQCVARVQVNFVIGWPIQGKSLHLGFTENLHKIHVYCQDISSTISWHYLFIFLAPSADISSQFVIYISGAVRRNMQQPRWRMVCAWQSQVLLCSTPFMSQHTSSCHWRFPCGHSSAATTTALPGLPIHQLGSNFVTVSDAFHSHYNQPCTIPYSSEDCLDDLLTGQ